MKDIDPKPNNRKYEFRVIAFLDILGFKALIENTKNDENLLRKIINAIELLRSEFEHITNPKSELAKMAKELLSDPIVAPDYDTQAFQISDCLIVSKDATIPGAIEEMIADMSFAIHLLIYNGLLCRGSIALGDVLHTKNYIIGPAYIDAYLGEQKESMPCVSLSKDVYEFGLKNRHIDLCTKQYFDHYVKPHKNGYYFIDYFNDFEFVDVFESTKKHYEKLRIIIESQYKKANDAKTKNKYSWMIDNYNNSEPVKNRLAKPISIRKC